MGTGPFLKEIGGSGIALTIFDFILVYFFRSLIFIVEIKLIIVWFFLNLS